MFKVKDIFEGAEQYEVLGQRVLNAVQEELELFANVDSYFSLTAKDNHRGGITLELKSESLPLTLFNVGTYAYRSVILGVSGNLPEDKEKEATFGVGIRYTHRNGGSNGCNIANKGQTSFQVVYNQITNETKIKSENNLLKNAIRTLEIYLRSSEISNEILPIIEETKPFFRKDSIRKEDMKNLIPLLEELDKEVLKYLDSDNLDRFIARDVREASDDLKFVIKEFRDIIVK